MKELHGKLAGLDAEIRIAANKAVARLRGRRASGGGRR